jgi:tetratricopeptide (TPR) repeat protein
MWWITACAGTTAPGQPAWNLKSLVATIQKSVVTVVAYDMDGDLSSIGSGFFIDRDGTLVTTYHVLDGAYNAEVKTAGGRRYPVSAVIARNQPVDLMTVRVEIPKELAVPMKMADEEPGVADRVAVIGSPMGLAQTISEGIVSAVRKHPSDCKVYQLTAPISEGSSGSPALNLKGQVFGVVTYQSAKGQNLNFAVSVHALHTLTRVPGEISLVEWTIQKSAKDPRLAVFLCARGARLSIRGKHEAALDYFQKATETNPDDPDAWHGLGNCYIGLNQPENAIEAYRQSIAVNPDNVVPHFMLAMYYKVLKQYRQEIPSLLQVIKLDPDHMRARMELAIAYGELDQTEAQIGTLEEMLKLKPNHVPALHLMGQTVGRTGRYDEALDWLTRAGELQPDNAQIQFDIGVTYHLKKLPKEEFQAYIRAIQVDPRMAPAHYNIGLLFLNHGERKLALQQYEILKGLNTELAQSLFGKIYSGITHDVTKPELIEK